MATARGSNEEAGAGGALAASDPVAMAAPRELLPSAVAPGHRVEEVGLQLARRTRARLRQKLHVENLVVEAVTALNLVHSGGVPREGHLVSAGQVAGLRHVRQVCAEVGPPPVCAAAAFRELCGGLPGCYGISEPEARYQRHLVSLPEPSDLCDPAQVLEGGAHDL